MPGVVTTRLPGVTFDVVAPPPPAVLPRMDIAGFVGFAACGPVGVPVPVEDVGRFRDVFGPDLDLAWDPERDALATSLLGPAVEAFFRNGGRRCWVVRVASPKAVTHAFDVPGLWAVPTDTGALDWDARTPAEAAARCPGSWADGLAFGTVLRSVGLRPVRVERDGDTVAVEVVRPAQDTIEPGDLVCVALPGVLLYLFAASVEDVAPASLRVEGTEAVWLAASGAPDLETLLTLGPDALAAATEGEIGDALASGPEAAGRLRFDVLAWGGQEETARIRDLTFHPVHPRFWGALPSDDALFALDADRGDLPLAADADDPRVPFAGTGDLRPTIPLGMAVRPDPEAAAPPTTDASPETALARDGLDPFSAALFLDPALAGVTSHRLRDRATERTVVQGESLRALHALFPLDEVTLVAAPDAVHRGWGMTVVRLPDTIPAPTLDPIGVPDDRGVYPVSWSEVRVPERPDEAVEGYELEESTDAGFEHASLRYRGADTDAGFEVPAPPAQTLYYRVRAVEGGRVSAWSNTASTVLPPAPFDACRRPPAAPVLSALDAPPPTAERTLAWTLDGAEGSPPPDLALAFTAERAVDPAFVTARTLLDAAPADALARDGDAFTTGLALPESGVTYARVRAVRDGLAGPWSNTVALAPTPVETRALTDPDDYDDTALVDVHRALLRFCAARGDAFAVLAVPDHYERDGALAHRGRLATLAASEERALSFGALYYPWLAVRGPSDTDVRPVSPDGAVLGTYAEVALSEGAWIAPANRPIRDVLAVEPADDRAGWSTLFGAQVNTVRPDPRGVRLLSADTLSPDDALRPVHVRRLLSLLRRLALREGAVYAFEPNGPALQRRVFYQFDALLADLFRRGAFAGATPAQAFQVVTGSSVNPASAVDRGRFVVELRVAPARPLEFLVVRLLQQDAGGLAVDTA